jgi:uncharacterized membrane protein
LGLLIAVGVALIAYRAHALNLSGTIPAAVLGTVVFGLGGVGWALITLTSFFSSSRLSKLFAVRKESPGLNISRGSQRDTWQVAANGRWLDFFYYATWFCPGLHQRAPLAHFCGFVLQGIWLPQMLTPGQRNWDY